MRTTDRLKVSRKHVSAITNARASVTADMATRLAAVGQQVCATAMVYNTLRTSQAQIAATAAVAPELLSVDKLFPTLIDHDLQATSFVLGAAFAWERVHAEHPHNTRSEAPLDPSWWRVRIRDHLLEKRTKERTKRR